MVNPGSLSTASLSTNRATLVFLTFSMMERCRGIKGAASQSMVKPAERRPFYNSHVQNEELPEWEGGVVNCGVRSTKQSKRQRRGVSWEYMVKSNIKKGFRFGKKRNKSCTQGKDR